MGFLDFLTGGDGGATLPSEQFDSQASMTPTGVDTNGGSSGSFSNIMQRLGLGNVQSQDWANQQWGPANSLGGIMGRAGHVLNSTMQGARGDPYYAQKVRAQAMQERHQQTQEQMQRIQMLGHGLQIYTQMANSLDEDQMKSLKPAITEMFKRAGVPLSDIITSGNGKEATALHAALDDPAVDANDPRYGQLIDKVSRIKGDAAIKKLALSGGLFGIAKEMKQQGKEVPRSWQSMFDENMLQELGIKTAKTKDKAFELAKSKAATPESIAKYEESGNIADLVPQKEPNVHSADTTLFNKIVEKYNGDVIAASKDPDWTDYLGKTRNPTIINNGGTMDVIPKGQPIKGGTIQKTPTPGQQLLPTGAVNELNDLREAHQLSTDLIDAHKKVFSDKSYKLSDALRSALLRNNAITNIKQATEINVAGKTDAERDLIAKYNAIIGNLRKITNERQLSNEDAVRNLKSFDLGTNPAQFQANVLARRQIYEREYGREYGAHKGQGRNVAGFPEYLGTPPSKFTGMTKEQIADELLKLKGTPAGTAQ